MVNSARADAERAQRTLQEALKEVIDARYKGEEAVLLQEMKQAETAAAVEEAERKAFDLERKQKSVVAEMKQLRETLAMEELSASQVASADDGRHAERDSRGAATSDDAVIHTSCNLQTARNAVTMKQRVGFPRSKGQKQATRTFKFGGKALLIRQEVDEAELSMKREGMEEYAGVGMVVWNSGRCLAEFLIAEYSAEQGGMGGLS